MYEGQQAILRCNITTFIPEWKSPYGGQISFINSPDLTGFVPHDFRNRISLKLNELVINNTKKSDEGRYTCSYPGIGEAEVYLRVDIPVKGQYVPPRICIHRYMRVC